MTKPLILLGLCLVMSVNLSGQTYTMNGNPITDCSGAFYDSGGTNGNYGDNQHFITTICSDNTSGTHIQLNFAGLDIAQGDLLCFYDGPNISAPNLSCSDDYLAGEPFIVQATAANPTGCLTLEFTSDGSDNATGWAAVISCVASCQTVLANLVSTNPAAFPIDTGWIDVCPGERIFFNGAGNYPQNGLAYGQSDLTTTFEWNFGDGGIAYGPNTSHKFTAPGGYYVQLVLTDVQGCRSTNLINQRIRVAPRPNFALSGGLDNSICAGDTIHLSAAVDSTSGKNLNVTPNTAAFAVEGSRSDSLALPDGTGVPYETSIYFTEFSPGQVMTSAGDLESICVNMEHSWMRDMEISLTCPNGQNIILHNFAGQTGGQVFLGIPNDLDGFNPVPGIGYDYCWTPTATNPTWITYANTILGGNGTLPEGNYTPFNPMSDLIGCPLNGEWTITVTDLWPIDNGFIFSWSLKFKDELYPDIEKFTPGFTSWNWSAHPSIFYTSADSIAAAPGNAGTAGYVFTVHDEFGCTWDTLVNISVLPFLHPDCYSCKLAYQPLKDTVVCVNSPVQLNATPVSPLTQEVRFESFPDYKLGNSNHPHTNPYAAPISVNSLGINLLNNPAVQISSVCIDLETDFDADLNVYLKSPDGKQLELTTGNGGAGDNYKITCFSPTATTPVIGSTAPFNGTYKPEGSWTALNNAVVNGDWKLMVSDGFGVNQFGKVKWWSIGFNYAENMSYTWTNAASLSCNNCANPIATPSATSTYIVTSQNALNCIHKDTVLVTVSPVFAAPSNLGVTALGGGSMTWSWSAVPGAAGYEISINGGPWITPSGSTSHLVTGLAVGDVVSVAVRAISNNPNCPPAISNGSQAYVLCNLDATLSSTTPALCNGTATGGAVISVSNATVPVDFFLDNSTSSLPNGTITNLAAGNHFVIVQDAAACRDTVYFSITEPPAITLSTTAVDVLCNGDDTGKVTALATGGTGTFTYSWQKCTGGPTQSGAMQIALLAGCYRVTATDANGCTATATTTIQQPPAFQFSSSQDSVSCFGGTDGSATIFVTGATPPYTYSWANGNTTQTATNLNANFHTVAVTDFNGCQAVSFVQVLQPAQLVVDSVAVRSVSCFGSSNGTASIFLIGGTPPYTYLWNDPAGQTTQKAQNLAAGQYSVTITDHSGCTVVSALIVPTPTLLTLSVSNTTDEKCAGACDGSAAIVAAGGTPQYSITWSAPNVPANSLSSSTLCGGAYTVTVQDAKGCSQTTSFNINSAIPIQVQFQETPPSCSGATDGQALANVTGGLPPYQYTWSNGVTGTDILTGITCGKYGLLVEDAAGCQLKDTAQLDCPTTIAIQSVNMTPATCFSAADGELTVSAQGGSGNLTYSWSIAGGPNAPTVTGLTAGVYTVSIYDANGCSTTATGTVTEPTPLSISFTPTNVTCNGGQDGKLVASANGGTPNYTYNWNTGIEAPSISNLAAGTFTVTVTDSNGCTLSSTAPALTQPALGVQITVTQTKTACYGANDGQASALASGGTGPTYTYLWSNGQTTAQASGLAPGTHTVTVTDTKGCSASQNIIIQQLDSIDINVAYVPPTCFGLNNGAAAINFITGGAGNGDTLNYNYTWSIPAPDQTTLLGISGGQNYTVTVSDLQGCTGVFTFFVPAPQPIVIQLKTDPVTCNGGADGAAAVTGVQNATLPVSYLWSNSQTAAQIASLAAGIYTVTIQDNLGCTSTQVGTVTEPAPLQVAFQVKQLLCTNDNNAQIKAVIQGGNTPYTTSWNNGSSTAEITGLSAGNYILQITDKNGCQLTDSVLITRPDTITVNLEATDPSCFGEDNGRLKATAVGGQAPYQFQLDTKPFTGSPVFIGLKAGFYTVTARDYNGCTASASYTLTEPDPIQVDLGPDTVIQLGETAILTPVVQNGTGNFDYEWRSSLVDNYHCLDALPSCKSILVAPFYSNTFFVTITDENGCEGSDAVHITVEKPRNVYVPTGFSPDDNQTNDLLIVHGKGDQVREVVIFRIFDRWGEMLYEDSHFAVNDFARGWDGTFRGKDCDPGVYVWYLEVEFLDGYREKYSGNTTLIR